MPYCKDADAILGRQEPVKSDVTGLTIGNYKFSQFTFQNPADQRVIGECIDGIAYRVGRRHRCLWIVPCDEFESSLKIDERSLRINYLRHDRGRAALPLVASRPSQACTSSAL